MSRRLIPPRLQPGDCSRLLDTKNRFNGIDGFAPLLRSSRLHRGHSSFKIASPFVNQETPNDTTAKDSNQKTGL